jgi:soluble lytic murein transglycosylase
VNPRAPGFAAAFVLVALPALAATRARAAAQAGLGAEPLHGFWLQAVPEGAAETALRDALLSNAFAGPSVVEGALRRVSEEHPGTVASGLAQLAAGLLLLEQGRPAEAAERLRHPDIPRTALLDRALLARARAREAADPAGAGETYTEAAAAFPDGPSGCKGLLGAAEAHARAHRHDRSLEALERALERCAGQEAAVLLRIAEAHQATADRKATAQAYDRLDREHPGSTQAREARRRLKTLAARLPPVAADERNARDLKAALALFDAGQTSEAGALLRSLKARKLPAADRDLVRARLGRLALLAKRYREAEAHFAAVPAGSPSEAEAAFHLARIRAVQRKGVAGYEEVATRFAGTPWAEEALLALANNFQKDARDEQALPYYRRLIEGYPDGRYLERATWRVAWGDFRAGRFAEAAETAERTALLRPMASATAGLLYWAGRSRQQLGQTERARQLFEEAVRRFKHSYHGLRAREALARLPAPTSPPPPVLRAAAEEAQDIPPEGFARVRQLLLIDRLEEALEELNALPPSPATKATIAWIQSRRGRLRPALVAMKRAYPEYVGEAGDRLPAEAWRIMYPLQFEEPLRQKSNEQRLDPALVAALICQESTFDAGAVSVVGARGLMQIYPPTGRVLARSLGVAYRRQALHDPKVSLQFGTRYLRQMVDLFGGRVERALAAYNAGPHRVHAWTAANPDMSAEEFIESIPFTETRFYVMTILASQQHYRRIYSLGASETAATDGASR